MFAVSQEILMSKLPSISMNLAETLSILRRSVIDIRKKGKMEYIMYIESSTMIVQNSIIINTVE